LYVKNAGKKNSIMPKGVAEYVIGGLGVLPTVKGRGCAIVCGGDNTPRNLGRRVENIEKHTKSNLAIMVNNIA